jgi:hypothetical protein
VTLTLSGLSKQYRACRAGLSCLGGPTQ